MVADDPAEEVVRLREEVAALRRMVAELAAFQHRARFEEIEVERLNVVEPDGTLRLAIAGKVRSPAPLVDGKTLPGAHGKRAGLIFYNDEGDECGGLTFHGRREGDHYSAGAGLLFDQFKQDQIAGIMHGDANGRRWAGFWVWDRPDIPLPELAERWEAIRHLPDGPERTAAINAMREQGVEPAEVQRVFVGKTEERAAVIRLCDPQRRVRLLLMVDASGRPTLEFFDERGQAICRLPDALQGREGEAGQQP